MTFEHSMSEVGPMATDLPRADARHDIAGCLLEQKLESLRPHPVIGDLVLRVSSCLRALFRRGSSARHED